MIKTIPIILFIILTGPFLVLNAASSERPAVYPFDVSVGGQTAIAEGENPDAILFAKVEEPVPADAEIVVFAEGDMLIVNVFGVTPSGEVVENATPVAIIGEPGKNKVSLARTMDGSTLKPGLYGMNIIFGGMTARVMFTVE